MALLPRLLEEDIEPPYRLLCHRQAPDLRAVLNHGPLHNKPHDGPAMLTSGLYL